MTKHGRALFALLGFSFGMATFVAAPVKADPVAEFFRGKTVTIGVGFSAGGGYDLHARVLARHIGRHMPGNPSIVVKNMPGAAGLMLVNQMYNSGARDGTELATFDRAVAIDPLLDGSKAKFDALKMAWIGSTDADVSTCFSWHTSPVKTFEDVKRQELIVGASGSAGDAYAFPKILNATLGSRFRVIPGYPGSNDALLAIERGETHGFCSMGAASMRVVRPTWMPERKINVLLLLGFDKSADFPNVPLALDLAPTPADRQAIALIVGPQKFARPFAGPPGIPPERVQAWRKAFDATLRDEEYLKDAQKSGLNVRHVGGQEVEELLKQLFSTPPAVIQRVRQAIK